MALAQSRLVRLRRHAELCARYPDLAIAAGGMHVQDFINGVAFGRGVEQVLLDIAMNDPVYLYIMERRHRFYLAYIERILDAAEGANRLGALRRRFRQPAGPADLAGRLRSRYSPRRRRNCLTWFTPTAPRCRTIAADRAGL